MWSKTILELARKRATGTLKKADDAALYKTLVDEGCTMSQFEDLAGRIARIDALQAEASNIDRASIEAARARTAIESHDAEVKRVAAIHANKRQGLQLAAQDACDAVERASRARAQLDLIAHENPELLGETGIDYDRYTLRCGADLICVCDDDAPRREVPRRVFQDETERRCELLNLAGGRARIKHQRDHAEWRQAQRTGIGALFNKSEPVLREPTWAELVAAGVKCVEDLDRLPQCAVEEVELAGYHGNG